MNYTIGIAVPCYKRHIPHLQTLFQSIQNQTLYPAKVVVSCSSSEEADCEQIQTDYPFPIQILRHRERKNAAENRNIAAATLNTDIVCFFDADDIMHPQRLQAIYTAFQNSEVNIVLHSFTEGNQPFDLYDTFSIEYHGLRRAPSGCAILTGKPNVRIHHSQVSVRRHILEKTKFREEAAMERREDAVFCGDVLAYSENQNAYIADSLSNYLEEGRWY